jgi:hypothetical protein
VNAVAELEKLKKRKVFKGMSEVAVKIEQPPDDTGHAPEHEPFTDERKNVRIEKCALCGAEYFVAFSQIYRTKKGRGIERRASDEARRGPSDESQS